MSISVSHNATTQNPVFGYRFDIKRPIMRLSSQADVIDRDLIPLLRVLGTRGTRSGMGKIMEAHAHGDTFTKDLSKREVRELTEIDILQDTPDGGKQIHNNMLSWLAGLKR